MNAPLAERVATAVAGVNDPEYPDVSIRDLGMVVAIHCDDEGAVAVELVPTVLGCPALAMIEADVRVAVEAVPDVGRVSVRWLSEPIWTPERIAPSARRHLAAEYTIAIRGVDGTTICPVCGSRSVDEVSPFGPTRCRSIAYCPSCRNPLEVIR